jgi:exodeoxyribonuclease-5
MEALGAIKTWFEGQADWSSGPFRLFGPAGTGKTTLAKNVAEHLGIPASRIQFGAYTGKAANVLRTKGCDPSGTIHSLIYKPMRNPETLAKLAEAQERLGKLQAAMADPEVGNTLDAEIQQALEDVDQLTEQSKVIGFQWNPESVLAHEVDLFILDEVSMVDAKLADDIERFNVPVLVLGDPEQLEPVGGEGYYTDAAPDYALTEIHRQALDSPVLEMATRVRSSRDRRLGLTAADMITHSADLAMEHDQVLCWKNATRWAAINVIRTRLGRQPGEVTAGDRIMCLTNNRDLGVFNGQQWTVVSSIDTPLGPDMMLVDDEGAERRLHAFRAGFQGAAEQDAAKKAYHGGKGNRMLATFSQAITVHKSQGSEWGSVYVVNEAPALMSMTASRKGEAEGVTSARRWLYTAITRASKSVTITTPRGSGR